MLRDILESKHESAVLGFFLAAPHRSFPVKEISKRLRMPQLRLVHVLNRLAKENYLFVFSKHGKRYYLLNSRHKFLPEMRAGVFKAGLKYNDELLSAIRKLGKIKAAFLSGVFTGYASLPVDLLLVGRVNLKKLDKFLKSAGKLMGQEINYSIMSVGEFVERRDTFDRFIKDIFDYRHLVVVDKLGKK